MYDIFDTAQYATFNPIKEKPLVPFLIIKSEYSKFEICPRSLGFRKYFYASVNYRHILPSFSHDLA